VQDCELLIEPKNSEVLTFEERKAQKLFSDVGGVIRVLTMEEVLGNCAFE